MINKDVSSDEELANFFDTYFASGFTNESFDSIYIRVQSIDSFSFLNIDVDEIKNKDKGIKIITENQRTSFATLAALL